ncbi:membrane metallo-endopeptidase-like 1 [Haemaphysalis longicornis]
MQDHGDRPNPPCNDRGPLVALRVARYVWVCNYATYSVLVVLLAVLAMGVVGYIFVPERKSARLRLNFTDELVGPGDEKAASRPGIGTTIVLESDLCGSLECNHEAMRIVSSVNASVDPCDDFYEYVCSVWANKHRPAEDQDRRSVDDDILDSYSRFLVGILGHSNGELPAAKVLFDACTEPPASLFREVVTTFFYMVGLQHWPYSPSDRILAVDVSSKLGTLYRLLGLDGLFHLSVVEDPDDKRTFMSIGEPELVSGFAEGSSIADFAFLTKAHEALMSYLGRPLSTNIALVEMEIARRMAPQKAPGCYDLLSQCATVLLDQMPESHVVHWGLLLEEAFGSRISAVNRFVKLPNYEYLLSFASNVHQTMRKPDILNYLAFRICMALSPLVANATVRHQLASIAYSRNPRAAQPILAEFYCVRLLDRFEAPLIMVLAYDRSVAKLGWEVIHDLALRHLNSTLAGYLRYDFSRLFSREFADYVSRQLARISWEPLIPQRFFDETYRSKYLGGLYKEDSSSSLPSFFYFWLERALKRKRGSLETGEDDLRTGWSEGILRTWPHLGAPFRRLEIPLPVFDFGMPVDPKLRKFHIPRVGTRVYWSLFKYIYFLSYGFYLNTSWSDPASVFENLRGCLQKDYALMSASSSHYSSASTLLLIERTSTADMLDVLAVRLAYQSFEEYMLKELSNFRFRDARQFVPEQLFFIYYGMSFCENVNPRFAKQEQMGDTSSGWARVNGPLRHTPEFATAFGCTEGSFMNPKDKCKLDEVNVGMREP